MEDTHPDNLIKSYVFLDNLYVVLDDEMLRPSMQFFLQYFRINNNASTKHIESDIPDWYDMLDIHSSLLDQFNNNNIIKFGLRD